jgi:tripartite-type tricarboxylate transporter receptor subunit TctC
MSPAGIPPDAFERIARETQKAMQQPDVKQILESQGFEVIGSSPQALRDLPARRAREVGEGGARNRR